MSDLSVHDKVRIEDAANRGRYDAARDRPPLWRKRKCEWVPKVDDPQADDWTQLQREAYMQAYDAYDGGEP